MLAGISLGVKMAALSIGTNVLRRLSMRIDYLKVALLRCCGRDPNGGEGPNFRDGLATRLNKFLAQQAIFQGSQCWTLFLSFFNIQRLFFSLFFVYFSSPVLLAFCVIIESCSIFSDCCNLHTLLEMLFREVWGDVGNAKHHGTLTLVP